MIPLRARLRSGRAAFTIIDTLSWIDSGHNCHARLAGASAKSGRRRVWPIYGARLLTVCCGASPLVCWGASPLVVWRVSVCCGARLRLLWGASPFVVGRVSVCCGARLLTAPLFLGLREAAGRSRIWRPSVNWVGGSEIPPTTWDPARESANRPSTARSPKSAATPIQRPGVTSLAGCPRTW